MQCLSRISSVSAHEQDPDPPSSEHDEKPILPASMSWAKASKDKSANPLAHAKIAI